MKNAGSGSAGTMPHFESVKDGAVLFDRLTYFCDGGLKERPLELSGGISSFDGISQEELERTGLDWESDTERSEETSLKRSVDSLRRDLEDLKKERSRLRSMESEAEHVIANLRSGVRDKVNPDRILISEEELESLSRKVEESGMHSGKKVADVMAELEYLRKSESKALTKLEISRRELEDIKSAKEAAVKRAKLAETARAALEEELRGRFLKETEKPELVHASAWAAEADNIPGHRQDHPMLGRTTASVLSKSWRHAGTTLPDLVLDQRSFFPYDRPDCLSRPETVDEQCCWANWMDSVRKTSNMTAFTTTPSGHDQHLDQAIDDVNGWIV